MLIVSVYCNVSYLRILLNNQGLINIKKISKQTLTENDLQKYNEIVSFAVMAEWQTRQLEGLVGVSPVEVRVFLAA